MLCVMALLLFVCPKTNQQAPTGIETDVQSLSASLEGDAESALAHCGGAHEISVRKTYINGALSDATKSMRRVSYKPPPQLVSPPQIYTRFPDLGPYPGDLGTGSQAPHPMLSHRCAHGGIEGGDVRRVPVSGIVPTAGRSASSQREETARERANP
jgi:hypothetical protein